MDIKITLAAYGINNIALVAGIIGAIVVLTLDNKQISFRSAAAQVISSAALSGYFAELVANWTAKKFSLEQTATLYGVAGLVLGIGGLFLAQLFILGFKRLAENPSSFFGAIASLIVKPKNNNNASN